LSNLLAFGKDKDLPDLARVYQNEVQNTQLAFSESQQITVPEDGNRDNLKIVGNSFQTDMADCL
jgi:hypothetical protein